MRKSLRAKLNYDVLKVLYEGGATKGTMCYFLGTSLSTLNNHVEQLLSEGKIKSPSAKIKSNRREQDVIVADEIIKHIDLQDFENKYRECPTLDVGEFFGLDYYETALLLNRMRQLHLFSGTNSANWKRKILNPINQYGNLNTEELIQEYNNSYTIQQIAEKHQVPYSRVYYALKQLESDGKLNLRVHGYKIANVWCELRKDLFNFSIKELSKKYGLATSEISTLRRKVNQVILPSNKNGVLAQAYSVDLDVFDRLKNKMSIKELMSHFKISEATVRSLKKWSKIK